MKYELGRKYKELTQEMIDWANNSNKYHFFAIELDKNNFEYELRENEIYKMTEQNLRFIRKSLLQAFDIYKSNVQYGIVEETEEEHKEIIKWYTDILDLKESSIENIPEKIKRYL